MVAILSLEMADKINTESIEDIIACYDDGGLLRLAESDPSLSDRIAKKLIDHGKEGLAYLIDPIAMFDYMAGDDSAEEALAFAINAKDTALVSRALKRYGDNLLTELTDKRKMYDLLPDLGDSLLWLAQAKKGYATVAAQILMDHEYWEEAYLADKKNTRSCFATEEPADALVFAVKIGDKKLMAESLQHFEESEDYLEAYRGLIGLSIRGTDGIKRLWEQVGEISSLEHYGEIHQIALDAGDAYTLNKIAESLKDDDPEEALLLAIETGNSELEHELEQALYEGVPNIEEYECMVATAQSLVSMVEDAFGLELPKKIKTGGPKGSYATIRYKGFGENKDGNNFSSAA